MAIQVTIWRPDTCGCEIILEWDDTLPDTARRHVLRAQSGPLQTILCPVHSTMIGWDGTEVESDIAPVCEENHRKNTGLAIAIGHIPGLTMHDVLWHYDANRLLVFEIPPGKMTVPQQNSLNGLLIAQFGPSKVQVVRV